MRQPAGNWLLLAVIAGVLAACASGKETPVDPNLLPTNYKQEILNTLTTTLVDPTNVRDAGISDPALTTLDNDQRYTSCVRYTARDASRQYGAPTVRVAYFYGGHLNQFVVDSKDQCRNGAYKPFPELEKLCLSEQKCK